MTWLVLIIAAVAGLRWLLAPGADYEPLPECMTCGQRFLDGRGVDWHRQACHPPDLATYDEGTIARWNR